MIAMRLGTRILLPALVALAAVAALGAALSGYLIVRQEALRSSGAGTLAALRLINRVDESSGALRWNVLAYHFDRKPARMDAVRAADADIARLMQEYGNYAAAGDPRGGELLARFSEARDAALRSRAGLLAAIDTGEAGAIRLAFDKWGALGRRVDATLADLAAHGSLRLERTLEQAGRDQYSALRLGALGLALTTALFVVAMSVAQRRLEARLASLAAEIRRIGTQPPSARLDSEHEAANDEIGELARAFAAMARRIDESHRGLSAEAAQRKAAEERLEAVIETASDAIIALDGHHRIVLFNPAAERMFGHAATQMRGGPLDPLLPARFRHAHGGHLERFGTGEPTQRPMGAVGDIWGLRADGEEFPIEASISRTAGGPGCLYTVILRDVTERRHAEAEKDRLKAELERHLHDRDEAIRELESFSGSISHDLRAPLRAIEGYARMAQEAGRDSGQVEVHLQSIRANAVRMAELIDDLLRLARVSRQPLQTRPTDPHPQVDEALAQLGEARRGREVRIEVGTLPAYQVDAALMRQVWTNLLDNALKFARRCSPALIEVGAYPGAGGATVYFVRDNGIGFDMRSADRLFREFHRLHPADEYPGNGIGLAIVQRIVRRHGGRIWAEATPGQGATFHFTLDPGTQR